MDSRMAHLILTGICLIGGGLLLHFDPQFANAVFGLNGLAMGWWFIKNGDNTPTMIGNTPTNPVNVVNVAPVEVKAAE